MKKSSIHETGESDDSPYCSDIVRAKNVDPGYVVKKLRLRLLLSQEGEVLKPGLMNIEGL